MAPPGPPASAELDVAGLGRSLRSARRDRGLSLERLAITSGVSAGLISQLERGRGNPSFLTLRRLAAALELPFGSFVEGSLAPAPGGSRVAAGAPATGKPSVPWSRRPAVVRALERKSLVLPREGLVYELLTPDLRGVLEVLRTQVPPGFSNAERPFRHQGEECVHLLSGALELVVGEQVFDLEGGDTATYDSSVAHWWTNRGSETAVLIGVVTPPSF
ncbi:MAG: cupin domain-containing protein [Actinomycetota bacterium]|nr:cupin domain-containing protein [Actinomycetota bacterium]